MCSKHKSWEYYRTRESKNYAKESMSCFSLNSSEISTKTAFRKIDQSTLKNSQLNCQKNYETIKQVKSNGQETKFPEKRYETKHSENPMKNCCKKYYEQRDTGSSQEFTKGSSVSLNFSEFSIKTLPRDISKMSQKSKSKSVCNEKLWEIERHNEHFMKKLMKAKPTTDIKKSTSEMTLLQTRSEKHIPPASIRRRQKQQEINAINGIIQRKLNAIASKKSKSI